MVVKLTDCAVTSCVQSKVTLQERTLQIHCAQNSYLQAKAAPSGAGSKNDQMIDKL